MQVLLSSHGSRGDVQPILALAVELQARGHRARVCAAPNFKAWIEAYGVECVPVGPDLQRLTGGSVPGKPTLPPLEQLQQLADQMVREQFQVLGEAAQGCDVIVAAGALQIAARSIAEAQQRGYVFAAYCPAVLPSPHYPPPKMGSHHSFALPESANLALWAEDEAEFNARFGTVLNAERARLGLDPVASVQRYLFTGRPWLAADPALAPVYPLAAPAAPLPGMEVVQTGAWLLPAGAPGGTHGRMPGRAPDRTPGRMPDGTPGGASDGTPGGMPDGTPGGMPDGTPGGASDGTPDGAAQPGAWPEALERFLGRGTPPVYLGFGSMRAAEQTGRVLLEAARMVGRRAILSQGWAGLSADGAGGGTQRRGDYLVIGDVDHARLFPRLAAVVHHGGAGTTTAAALAGRAQVIIPHNYDQFYWAHRVEQLGVGVSGPLRDELTPAALAQALDECLRPAVAQRAEALSGRMERHGAQIAAERLVSEFG